MRTPQWGIPGNGLELVKKGLHLLRGPSAVSIFSVGIRVGGSLLTLPIALKLIPSPELGLYYTFLVIAALTTLLDFGFASTVARNCTYAFSGASHISPLGLPPTTEDGRAPNHELLSKLTGAFRFFYYLLAVVIGIILVFGGGIYVQDQISREGLPPHLLGAWLLFALTSAHGFGTGFWNSFLVGIGEVGLAARIGLFSQAIGVLLVTVSLIGGLGIWSYGLGLGISGVIGRHIAKSQYLKRVSPESSGGWQSHREILATMWPMAWRQGLALIGVFMIQRFGTLLVTSELGLREAASYGLTIQVQAVIFQVCGVPLVVAMPYLTRWRVQGNIARVKKEFMLRTYLGLAAACVMLLCLAGFGQDALALLGSDTAMLPMPLFMLCAVFGLLDLHTVAHNHLVLAENRNPFVYPFLLTGIATIAIGIFAVKQMGVAGVILASGVAQCAFLHWFSVLHGRRVFKEGSLSPEAA